MRLVAFALFAFLFAAPAPATEPRLDMIAFFTGRTAADNLLRVVLHPATSLNVESVGRMEGRKFVLLDTVHEGSKPVRQRKWVTHEVGPGHFVGTLSDAVGPVDINVSDDTAVVRYRMKGGLDITQTMVMQADGKSLSNRTVAKKFGLTFARVDGTIRKLD